jgi:MFS superfamily sulfate permease-like transporter
MTNLIVVALSAVVIYVFQPEVAIVGKVPVGHTPRAPPGVSSDRAHPLIYADAWQKGLPTFKVPALEHAGTIVYRSLPVVLVAFMEAYAISRKYASIAGYKIDANQASASPCRGLLVFSC